ncbi:TolC family protein [Pontibacter rugosus]|uniref:TolC family protein n=1 Tax=Pontibacter rugosus TaxID=1745966 RepID=A0ABW3SPT6_9BACT
MKKLPKHLLLAIGLSLAGAPAAWAQQAPGGDNVWTLQEAVEYAKTNNLQVKQRRINRNLTEVELNQSKLNRLPILNANGNYTYNTGSFQDPSTFALQTQDAWTGNFSANASVPLFQGFQQLNQIKQNQLELQASELDVLSTQNDITLNIITSYLNILFADELIKNSELQRTATQRQLDRTRILFNAGSLAENSVLDLESQLATDELNVINAQNQRDVSRLTLMQLLNIPSSEEFSIAIPELPEPDQNPLVSSGQQVFEVAVQTLPAIKAVDLRVQSADKALDVARGAYYPRLSLGAGINTRYSSTTEFLLRREDVYLEQTFYTGSDGTGPQKFYITQGVPVYGEYSFLDQAKDNVGKSVGLSLSLPIFNGFQVRNNVQRAKISKENAEINADIARNNLRQTIEQSYVDAVAARRKFSASTEQVRAAEKNLQNAELRLNAGVINSVEYIIVSNTYRRALSDLLQAKYDYFFKLKVLDFYQGKDISF